MKTAVCCMIAFVTIFPAQGQQVWNFTLKDVKNNIRTFEELQGEKLTIIDFWTTWCKPCKKSIPELIKIYEEYQDKGVQVIGINCDGPRSTAKVAPFTHSMKITYPVLIDINSEIMNSLNLSNFPTLIMANEDGLIEYTHEGYVSGDEEDIRSEIEKILSDVN